jgi:hypothetical protein
MGTRPRSTVWLCGAFRKVEISRPLCGGKDFGLPMTAGAALQYRPEIEGLRVEAEVPVALFQRRAPMEIGSWPNWPGC